MQKTPDHVRLSVNLNKVALIRNARGENLPDLRQVAVDCEAFGAEGITVHPRPDQRHIRYADLPVLREVVKTELNIEGNPTPAFLEQVLAVRPDQCTLVPDAPDALTSTEGWDTLGQRDRLRSVIATLQDAGIRVSVFVNAKEDMVRGARDCGADRVELYTGDYARQYASDPGAAVAAHIQAAEAARDVGLGLNAGHDLNLQNLAAYVRQVPGLLEVSIGHALISDALYFGLANVIPMYRRLLG